MQTTKKNIAIITFVRFWEEKEGANATIAARFRNIRGNVFLVYCGRINKQEREKINKKFKIQDICIMNSIVYEFRRMIRFVLTKLRLKVPYFLQRQMRVGFISKHRFNKFLKKNRIDVVLCEYIWLTSILEGVQTVKLLDSHDIQHFFCIEAKKTNPNWKPYIKQDDEINVCKKYDAIVCLSKEDGDYFGKYGLNTVWLPPVSSGSSFRQINKTNLNVGFIGGGASFNYDAVKWFVENVASKIDDIVFNVYGSVCKKVDFNCKNMVLHGFVENVAEAYENNHVMVNPTFMFGGIKTKNIEALCHGKVVITTEDGIRGLRDFLDQKTLYNLNTPDEYIQCINKLKTNLDYFNKVGNAISSKVASVFSVDLYNSFDIFLTKLLENNN